MNFLTSEEIDDIFGPLDYESNSDGSIYITNCFIDEWLVDFIYGKYCTKVHKLILPALSKAIHVIERNIPFCDEFDYIRSIMAFEPRHLLDDIRRPLSSHAYGIGIDINKYENEDDNPNFKIPKKIVEVFENVGFAWGGRIRHYSHFEPSDNFFSYREKW